MQDCKAEKCDTDFAKCAATCPYACTRVSSIDLRATFAALLRSVNRAGLSKFVSKCDNCLQLLLLDLPWTCRIFGTVSLTLACQFTLFIRSSKINFSFSNLISSNNIQTAAFRDGCMAAKSSTSFDRTSE